MGRRRARQTISSGKPATGAFRVMRALLRTDPLGVAHPSRKPCDCALKTNQELFECGKREQARVLLVLLDWLIDSIPRSLVGDSSVDCPAFPKWNGLWKFPCQGYLAGISMVGSTFQVDSLGTFILESYRTLAGHFADDVAGRPPACALMADASCSAAALPVPRPHVQMQHRHACRGGQVENARDYISVLDGLSQPTTAPCIGRPEPRCWPAFAAGIPSRPSVAGFSVR